MADANQQLLDRINALVAAIAIGNQNTAQANANQLIQDAIVAIQANTAAGGGGGAGWAGGAPTLFAISPGTVAPDRLIDFSTKKGSYHYKA